MKQNSPSAGAASVPAQIIKGAGFGLDAECAAIFAQFNPPINPGTYDSVSKQRRQAVSEDPDCDLANTQGEHQIVNSNFQTVRGDNGTNIPGCGGYSEGGAPAYNVYDNQSVGTEHKLLTDAARDLAQSQNPPSTLGEWLDGMEKKTSEMLDSDDLQRQKGGGRRSRIKDAEKKTPAERKALADKAAKCLKEHAERVYKGMGIERDQKLRNGFVDGKPKPKLPKKAPMTGGAI